MVSAVQERPTTRDSATNRYTSAAPEKTKQPTNIQPTNTQQAPVTPVSTTSSNSGDTGPTPVAAADARTRVRADPIAQQLRARTELALAANKRNTPVAQAEETPPATEDGFPADGSVEDARKYLADNPPAGDDPSTWTEDQLEAFNVVGQDFGEQHKEHHEEWHRVNGPGGTNGPGSGEDFLVFHRDMMNDFEEQNGIAAPGGWDPSSPVPDEITTPDGADRRTNDPDVYLPNWLSPDGTGTEQGNADFGESVTIDGQTFDSLDDFENPDQLGRALGESRYHASVHGRLGGVMGGFASPTDAAFYLWHGHIDGLVDQWLETDNGKAWAAANPDHELLNSGPDEHAGHH